MLFPIVLLLPIAASVALYLYLARRASSELIWRSAVIIALTLTAVRVGGVWLGRYWLEETSGWLQLPGYFMALWSLPEVLLAPGLLKQHGTGAFALLCILLGAGSSAWVFSVAFAAIKTRRGHPGA